MDTPTQAQEYPIADATQPAERHEKNEGRYTIIHNWKGRGTYIVSVCQRPKRGKGGRMIIDLAPEKLPRYCVLFYCSAPLIFHNYVDVLSRLG